MFAKKKSCIKQFPVAVTYYTKQDTVTFNGVEKTDSKYSL